MCHDIHVWGLIYCSICRNKFGCGVLCSHLNDEWLQGKDEVISGLSPENEDSLTDSTHWLIYCWQDTYLTLTFSTSTSSPPMSFFVFVQRCILLTPVSSTACASQTGWCCKWSFTMFKHSAMEINKSYFISEMRETQTTVLFCFFCQSVGETVGHQPQNYFPCIQA